MEGKELTRESNSKLDLHGIRHAEVDRIVENFILLNQRNFPLEIICGNSHKMKMLVTAVAKRLKCQTNSDRYGTIMIRGWS